METITAYAQDLSETQVGCEDGRCGQLPVGVERGGFSAVLGPDRSCVAVWNRQQQGTLA